METMDASSALRLGDMQCMKEQSISQGPQGLVGPTSPHKQGGRTHSDPTVKHLQAMPAHPPQIAITFTAESTRAWVKASGRYLYACTKCLFSLFAHVLVTWPREQTGSCSTQTRHKYNQAVKKTAIPSVRFSLFIVQLICYSAFATMPFYAFHNLRCYSSQLSPPPRWSEEMLAGPPSIKQGCQKIHSNDRSPSWE